MRTRTALTIVALAVLGGCGESEQKAAVEKSSEGSLHQGNRERQGEAGRIDSGPEVGLEGREQTDLKRMATDPEYRRRRTFEEFPQSSKLFLGIRKEETGPTRVREDGLLQRRVSFEVQTAFWGVQAGTVVVADELVADHGDFMGSSGGNSKGSSQQESVSKEPKAYLLRLAVCLEQDGTERLVMYRAHIASATKLSELTEDSKRYTAKGNYPLRPCEIGTLPLFIEYVNGVELRGDYFPESLYK